jgi:hypothetical protein
METVRTSQSGWLEAVARIYRQRRSALLIDDAGFGIDPACRTLLDMAKRASLSNEEFFAVCVALGMSAVGIGMVLLAVFDPEPTSKLSLLVAGGVISVLGGGFSAIYILTKLKPPNVRVTLDGIEISWA